MYKIKIVAVHPAVLDIVDKEFDIRWHPYWLYRTEI